ncbi:beta-ketoacyl synthase N-terminal-like domain-containing protein [Polyangium sp. 6x1]|uniref:beta-ketoacyl synthase N-terminal-like domain-containing protein n=1 Tax=Polyangium sp. 6x1 TaxID=3042689 RepID=UPI0024821721|nr:beta-ketoacyl synthase N-terminal-like domain-containing protein [Polyangium sp. 6x1]MDI1447181.1 beta-ketoacyl synthase N-terminal-like domain-containing protein [Polyangium sp. 6x1]
MRLDGKGLPVVAVSTLTAAGLSGPGLARRVLEDGIPSPRELAAPAPSRPEDIRQRKLMSRAAWFSALVMRGALAEARWDEGRDEIGAFFGVGASGAEMDEVARLVAASMVEGQFSLARCGREGLDACNPLFAFQIMNNFTLCHGAILEGLAGPNAAFFSRGAGTLTALEEACAAITSGACERALVGGADTALHPVTMAELEREGFLRQGLMPAEGAAALAITSEAEAPLGYVEAVRFFPVDRPRGALVPRTGVLRDAAVPAALDALEDQPCDVVVLAPWGAPAREALVDLPEMLEAELSVDASLSLGESLAATPALAWVLALDLLVHLDKHRALVLSAGPDGDLGAVVLTKGGA